MLFSCYEIIFFTINNEYERYTIIIHTTADAAIDNLLMRFNFMYATKFLHSTFHRSPQHRNLKNDFHISLATSFNEHIHRARAALHYWIET